jgi:hypothetical protein
MLIYLVLKYNFKTHIRIVVGGRFGSFGFASVLACGRGQNQMCQMWDSQNAIGEKVRWGKNLNICVGLSVGIFLCLKSVKLK